MKTVQTFCLAPLILSMLGGSSSQLIGTGKPGTIQQIKFVPTLREQKATEDSPIRLIDFRNYTYPYDKRRYGTGKKKTFTVLNGEEPAKTDKRGKVSNNPASMESIIYGDLTNDGMEEAVITINFTSGGSALPHSVYIYTWSGGKPRLIWLFSDGDRINGGLRRVLIENRLLILEIFDPADAQCDSCPENFVRIRYKWIKGRFKKVDKSKLVPLRPGD